MAKWIQFIDKSDPKQKTKRFMVGNKENGFIVGWIKWYGPFRQYSFFPTENTVFERTCLKDITEFIEKLMAERKGIKIFLGGQVTVTDPELIKSLEAYPGNKNNQ